MPKSSADGSGGEDDPPRKKTASPRASGPDLGEAALVEQGRLVRACRNLLDLAAARRHLPDDAFATSTSSPSARPPLLPLARR